MQSNPITVRQLNSYVKSLIEGDARLSLISVTGELSNVKIHYQSGHLYFTLKDNEASIKCVMFKSSVMRMKFTATDGMQVVLRGRVSIYERDGQYQFYAEEMHEAGEGDLALAFKQIKEKLQSEGLFDEENKRPLKRFPRKIAVITSSTGAAVKDILNITSKRYPLCKIVMCHVSVQGELAVGDMLKALDRVYALEDIDTIIIGRGGGSAEDLWAFNDEALARKIYESPIPVISAVGHETDFSICDFVADVRASTPSHAAELAVPDISEIRAGINKTKLLLSRRIFSKYELCEAKLSAIKNKAIFLRPYEIFEKRILRVDIVLEKLLSLMRAKLSQSEKSFLVLLSKLEALSPIKTLKRGFATVQKKNKLISSVDMLAVNDSISLHLADGEVKAEVREIMKGNNYGI